MSVRNLEILASNYAFSFPTKMLTAIKENAVSGQTINYRTTLGGRADIEQKRLSSVLNMRPVPGVIGISVRPDPEFVEMYRQAGISLVIIDEEAEGASTIAVDNYKGGVLAARRFLESGKKIPGIVCGRTEVKGGINAVQRLQGFQDTLESAGREKVLSQNIKQVLDYSYQDGIDSMQEFFRQQNPPDFIFSAAGDDCAVGILRASVNFGLSVPKDLSVMGFDDLEMAKMTTPTLTTIRQPIKEIAARAYGIASTMGNRYIDSPEQIVLEPTLVERDSA